MAMTLRAWPALRAIACPRYAAPMPKHDRTAALVADFLAAIRQAVRARDAPAVARLTST